MDFRKNKDREKQEQRHDYSLEYRKFKWDALRKSIFRLINKVSMSNIHHIVGDILNENLLVGRGLFCNAIMKSQMASPQFSNVFAAFVAVINSKLPDIGLLLVKRVVLQFKKAYEKYDKLKLLAVLKFLAHLVNQSVVHEVIAMDILSLLLGNPNEISIEVAVCFCTDCGSLLQDFSPHGLNSVFEEFHAIVHEGVIDTRVQLMIEGLFMVRRAKFKYHPAIIDKLDLVEVEEQVTHVVSLLHEIDPETSVDVFRPDTMLDESEMHNEDVGSFVLDEDTEDDEVSSRAPLRIENNDFDSNDSQDEAATDIVNLRRTICYHIMGSHNYEEAGQKLLGIKLQPGQVMEICNMLLECCRQDRTNLRYYSNLAHTLCLINPRYSMSFGECFVNQFSMIHQLETNKLQNTAKFFAQLLGTNLLSWHVMGYIHLSEDDANSLSNIFTKILFLELSKMLGNPLLKERLNDPKLQRSLDSIFPRDNPRNLRLSVNFFTSIGLGFLTDNQRKYLKNIENSQKSISEKKWLQK
ncbi:MIF4G domain-containing protein/MA3 domain-containing protein [Abeliophyllum distichum]|uniref:MIF4G domain-containing protein/MA3 domain-containing protein n=1 Tax=Abeliophyllum distichum TaxID=126358 RepID=A0ABD1RXR2_9LAMI